MTFREYTDELNHTLLNMVGMTLSDLPDIDVRVMWEDECPIMDAAYEVLEYADMDDETLKELFG